MRYFTYEGDLGIFNNGYFILFFLAVLVGVFAFFLIKRDDQENYEANLNDPLRRISYDRNEAFEIAKIRYAKGEINEEEFEKIRKAVM